MDGDSLGKTPGTRNHLRHCVFRAVEILEKDLSVHPNVDALASQVGLSKFHFQRAFKAVVGESLNKHFVRLRVESAASMLKNSAWQIGDVAIACGFPNQANFSRDFTKIYGLSPQNYRKSEQGVPFLRGYFRKKPHTEIPTDHLPIPTVTIHEWPNIELITLRFYGSIHETISAWSELLSWAREAIPDLENARFFGLWFDEWTSATPHNASYRYECAILPASPLDITPPEPFAMRTLPAGKVATCYAKGNIKQLDRAWQAFGLGWLPLSGYQPRFASTGIAGVDEYTAEFALSSKLKQIVTSLTGFPLTMHLAVQEEILEI